MGYDKDIDHFVKGDGLDSEREQSIGQHIGYRYDVNLVPDYDRLTPCLLYTSPSPRDLSTSRMPSSA